MKKLLKAESPGHFQHLLTESELAHWLNMSVRTIQGWRGRDDGIPFVKIGRSVRYDLSVVQEYLKRNQRISTGN